MSDPKRQVSDAEAAVLLSPRHEAIGEALMQFHGPGAWELDAAADCIACIQVAIAIKMAVHKLPQTPAELQRIGLLVNELVRREVVALKERAKDRP